MDESAASRWTLISVLFSSVTLSASLAATLQQAALDLYQRDEPTGQVAGELVTGRVVNLRRTFQFGGISGPGFEARLETARGSGMVRYLLTRQGLELSGIHEPPASRSKPRYLN